MNKNVIYVGIDVDDNAFHSNALFPETGEVLEFKTKPTLKGLEAKLLEIKEKYPDFVLKIC